MLNHDTVHGYILYELNWIELNWIELNWIESHAPIIRVVALDKQNHYSTTDANMRLRSRSLLV